jgi:DNA polymerase III delta prime subunit
MQKNKVSSFLRDALQKGEEITPFLFVSKDLVRANTFASALAWDITKEYGVDKNYIFSLRVDEESLKIEQIKNFLQLAHRKSSFAFQIFIIEGISRLTLQSANAMLKFLEEPWLWNIVFLTNESEGGVLDTILSRVKVIPLWSDEESVHDEVLYTRIKRLVEEKDVALISHFYSTEITKPIAKLFLEHILLYLKKTLLWWNILKEIDDDIQWLEKNNLLPKYIVDKYIILLSNLYAR